MQTKAFSRKQRFNIGFLAGLGSGIVASGLMVLLSVLINGVLLPQILGDVITNLMPLAAFDYLHNLIGADAKNYLFYIILAGQCLVFALFGGLCSLAVASASFKRWRDEQEQLDWRVGVMLALVLWLLTSLVLLPVAGVGVFGANLAIGAGNTMFSLAVVGLAFGLLYVLLQNWLYLRRLQAAGTISDVEVEDAGLLRRRILRIGATTIGLGIFGALAWRFITGGANGSSATVQIADFKSKISPPPTPKYGSIQPAAGLSAEVTSNNDYYVVSKNLLNDPVVNASTWSLKVRGEVTQPYTLTYNDLLAMPMQQQYESMMCISNEVGGEYMSNGLWEGVPLADLLKRAGSIKPGATKVVLYAADDYSDSIHLTKALEPTTLVAVHMNGVTLPTGHGYPARLLVPGIYGMKHVKWITAIEVVNTDYQGFWQQRGWSDPAPIRMATRIDTPHDGVTLTADKPSYIAGVAFSGNKGISEVDVSLDGGKSWQVATLKQPLSDLTWVVWELPWQPQRGTHAIMARAIDLEGNVQSPYIAPPLPDGSSGYHTVSVFVN